MPRKQPLEFTAEKLSKIATNMELIAASLRALGAAMESSNLETVTASYGVKIDEHLSVLSKFAESARAGFLAKNPVSD